MVGELKTFGVEQGERGFLEREDDEPPQMHTFLRSLTWLVSHSFIRSFIHLHHSFTCTLGRWNTCSVSCGLGGRGSGQSPPQAYSPPGKAGTQRELALESDRPGFSSRLLALSFVSGTLD